MLKDKAKREYQREYMKRKRGLTNGSNKEGSNMDGSNISPDVRDLLDKITDPVWRDKLSRICDSLGRNRDAVWLGNFKLSLVSDLLAVTAPV